MTKVRDRLELLTLVVCQVGFLMAFATLTAFKSLHFDMTEMWAWGKEFQLGYDKHPPFSAWVVGLWFSVMPRANWSFYLLASLNAAVALVGVWMLAGLFLNSVGRMTSALLLVLTPSFSIWALKYNANAPLISLWPWTTYFFLRSLQAPGIGWSIAAGSLGAAALLTKYSSVILFATLLLAAAFHAKRKAYFASPALYVTLAVGCCLVAPHFLWAYATGFSGFQYALSKQTLLTADVLMAALKSVATIFGSLAVAAVAYAVAFGRLGRQWFERAMAAAAERDNRWLVCLALGPLVLSVTVGLVGNIVLNWNYLIPVFFAAPVAFFVLSRAVTSFALLKRLALCTAMIALAALAVTPVFAYYKLGSASPRKEAAIAATTLWHGTFGKRLSCVSGDELSAKAATFYSNDAPSYIGLDELAARRRSCGGVVIICEVTGDGCVERATRILGEGVRTTGEFIAHRRHGPAETRQFVFMLLGPEN